MAEEKDKVIEMAEDIVTAPASIIERIIQFFGRGNKKTQEERWEHEETLHEAQRYGRTVAQQGDVNTLDDNLDREEEERESFADRVSNSSNNGISR